MSKNCCKTPVFYSLSEKFHETREPSCLNAKGLLPALHNRPGSRVAPVLNQGPKTEVPPPKKKKNQGRERERDWGSAHPSPLLRTDKQTENITFLRPGMRTVIEETLVALEGLWRWLVGQENRAKHICDRNTLDVGSYLVTVGPP